MFWKRRKPAEETLRPGWTHHIGSNGIPYWLLPAGDRNLQIVGDPSVWMFIVRDAEDDRVLYAGTSSRLDWAMEGAETADTLPLVIRMRADEPVPLNPEEWVLQAGSREGLVYANHKPSRIAFSMEPEPEPEPDGAPVLARYMAQISPFVPEEGNKRIYDLGRQAIRLYLNQAP